ncbi:MAG: DUF1800 domain-containing protein [Planctomycetales bacterium]|nr:DUF1800 domain-containing protein [Planctomycetales bacterium]
MDPSRTTVRAALAMLAAALALPAAAQDPAAPGGAIAALEPLPEAEWTEAAAAHLLRRAGFGGTPADVAALHARGLRGAVDWLVGPSGGGEGDAGALPPFKATVTEHPSKDEMMALSDEERKERVKEYRRDDQRQLMALRAWWLDRMVRTPRPLEERMTLFWHGHFCSGHRDVKDSYAMHLQNETLRRHALGNFGALCRAIARDPAMLEYLDNRVNRRQHPNENFARELMELFTLGVGNYGEADIQEAARAFTGWTCEGTRFVERRRWHDPGEKTVLGQNGRWDGDDVIRILLEQPVCAIFLATKLFRHFGHEAPPGDVVRGLAETLRKSGYEIRPLLRRLFLSREFYAPRSVGTRVKSPVDMAVSLARAMAWDGLPVPAGMLLSRAAGQLGEELFEPPNVKGWPGGRDWIGTATLFGRYNLAGAMVASPREMEMRAAALRRLLPPGQAMPGEEMPGEEEDPHAESGMPAAPEGAPGAARKAKDRALRLAPRLPKAMDVLAAIGDRKEPGEIADALVSRFLAVAAPEALREALVAHLRPSPRDRDRLHGALKLLVSSPEFQLH